MPLKDITELFCLVDDFVKIVEPELRAREIDRCARHITRYCSMTMTEVIVIILLYYQSPCKNFMYFYQDYLPLYKNDFGKILSYNRFIEIKARALPYLTLMMRYFAQLHANNSNIAYIDSTMIPVCHNKRTRRHKVFKDGASLSKGTMGWCYGLKLHLIIDKKGNIMNFCFTKANVDDRKPVKKLTHHIFGLLFADKGYISQDLFEELSSRGLKLITGIKKGMKNKFMHLYEKILLKKRYIIESAFNILKNCLKLVHTRYRSVHNALTHLRAVLVAYSLKKSRVSNIIPLLQPGC